MRVELTTSPSQADIDHVRRGLIAYNLAQVPELYEHTTGDFAVVMHENSQVVAGALCEIDWGWLYFDSVWTDASVRGKGYGSLVIRAAEAHAVQHNIHQAYLFTTSFQARPFYEKLGYTCFGQVDDHPRGHSFYGMKKTGLQVQAIDPRVMIDAPPNHERASVIENGLLDEIATAVPLYVRKLAVFLRGDDNQIQGGAVGIAFWDWFDLQLLWIDDAYSGQGYGKQLLTTLETELRQRHLIGIRCDTASFQSLAFYQAQGFEVMGTLDNRPPKHTSYFLKKRL
ncbi:MAG: GNAT family N-acetyltransferase [Chloroflexota bacterium]